MRLCGSGEQCFCVVVTVEQTTHKRHDGSLVATSEPLRSHLRHRQCHHDSSPAAEGAALGGSLGGVQYKRRRPGAVRWVRRREARATQVGWGDPSFTACSSSHLLQAFVLCSQAWC